MSDGGQGRALLGVEAWKSSQKWRVQRSAVRSIAWLGVRRGKGSAHRINLRTGLLRANATNDLEMLLIDLKSDEKLLVLRRPLFCPT
jgi:hypothetical protein